MAVLPWTKLKDSPKPLFKFVVSWILKIFHCLVPHPCRSTWVPCIRTASSPSKKSDQKPSVNHIGSSTSHQILILVTTKITSFRMTCNVMFPWLHSDVMFPWLQLLEEGERVTISGNRVQVRELDRADGGVYTCTFKNIVGQVSHIIKLVIEGKKTIITPYTLSVSVLSPFTASESEIVFAFAFAFARCEQALTLFSLCSFVSYSLLFCALIF